MVTAIIITSIIVFAAMTMGLCRAAGQADRWKDEHNSRMREYLKYHDGDVE